MIGDPIDRTDVPDMIEPIVGVRGWHYLNGKLLSPGIGHEWTGTTEHASCQYASNPLLMDLQAVPWHPSGISEATHEHTAPHPHCDCGLYAFHSAESLQRHYPHVPAIGIVQMWGACEVHADGVRAEWMRICALSYRSQSPLLSIRRSLQILGQSLAIWAALVVILTGIMSGFLTISWWQMWLDASRVGAWIYGGIILTYILMRPLILKREEAPYRELADRYGVPFIRYHSLSRHLPTWGRTVGYTRRSTSPHAK